MFMRDERLIVCYQTHSKLQAELSWPAFRSLIAGYKVRVLQPHRDVWYFQLIVVLDYIDFQCKEYVMAQSVTSIQAFQPKPFL